MKRYILIGLILLCSCTSLRIIEKEVPIETIKTEYINTVQYDSIYVKDSINTVLQNDTVFITNWKYLYKYKYYTDTVVRQDSIEVPMKITQFEVIEVNKLKGYQYFLMYLGLIPLIVILVWVIYGILTVFKNKIK